jgi:hypothetical protein
MLPNLWFSLVLGIETVSCEWRELYIPLKICYFHLLEDLSLSHLTLKTCLQDMPADRARHHLQSVMTVDTNSSKTAKLNV